LALAGGEAACEFCFLGIEVFLIDSQGKNRGAEAVWGIIEIGWRE
jgi:hypothetical protein